MGKLSIPGPRSLPIATGDEVAQLAFMSAFSFNHRLEVFIEYVMIQEQQLPTSPAWTVWAKPQLLSEALRFHWGHLGARVCPVLVPPCPGLTAAQHWGNGAT
jgi:hypothetical protein